MGKLIDLPNVGKVLEGNLIKVGIETSEDLRATGAEATFIKIRSLVDDEACLHMLYGIQGAIEGIPDKNLSEATKLKLKNFYNSLQA
ncbi:DNA transformation protein [Enterococcus sp. PF1-24]|uniref:TfoX/Sxy family DNA transformation protein n=1 Tax=unclassified Enterococcus TaxID=2608891 RepID=UPI002475E17C|nr:MULTISPECIES: TfoX/Sxy family DNA transformation protein [unclassified Enterococcus]MDH6364570.1 DNA transformation protein [Enterococcus sp. PFB1-1]MDH6401671.1 DNA transformation protein [Enterococcus sp. PF1-24]